MKAYAQWTIGLMVVTATAVFPACAMVADDSDGAASELTAKKPSKPSTTGTATSTGTATATSTATSTPTTAPSPSSTSTSAPSSACPAAWPSPGSTCTGTPSCSYDNSCGTKSTFTCSSGFWVGGVEGCGVYIPPPSSVCPPSPPAITSACGSIPSTVQCSYANTCGGSDVYQCTWNGWGRTSNVCGMPAPACPASMPVNGAACTTAVTCGYYNGCGIFTAKCDGAKWSVAAPSGC
jgi:hypothetical protein